MPSIVNGLFAGRSGISSHGTAISVIGDNISNANTVGYKVSRAEFQDLIAGGQSSSTQVGSGSSVSAVTSVFQQGTLEFTDRALDLAVDGNGLFVLKKGEQRFYTRAGNFKVDSDGFIVNSNGLKVQGFPNGGSGGLEDINVNSVAQDSVATTTASLSGNLDASKDSTATPVLPAQPPPADGTGTGSAVTYADLANSAEYSTVVDVFDSLGSKHTVSFFFTKEAAANTYSVKGYVNSEDVDSATPPVIGAPRLISSSTDNGLTLKFNSDGTINLGLSTTNAVYSPRMRWNNGSTSTGTLKMDFSKFTQYSSPSNITAINQNGKGVGTITDISIEKNGDIYAVLSNGQSSIIGTVGMASFSNVEGLSRVGGTLLQQSSNSGEPVLGKPGNGNLGIVQSGALELSTVDIADQFVKLITVQRGFQANSRIITTINQLLNDIIQLA